MKYDLQKFAEGDPPEDNKDWAKELVTKIDSVLSELKAKPAEENPKPVVVPKPKPPVANEEEEIEEEEEKESWAKKLWKAIW
jgi:hypothetical protein